MISLAILVLFVAVIFFAFECPVNFSFERLPHEWVFRIFGYIIVFGDPDGVPVYTCLNRYWTGIQICRPTEEEGSMCEIVGRLFYREWEAE